MLILLSPSKKLDETSEITCNKFSQPFFINEAEELVNSLKKLSAGELSDMMKLSINLSNLNHKRFNSFKFPFTRENSRQAIFTFKGDVYDKMEISSYTEKELNFAQQHLLILSGLYGILKPLDLIQPYRLEMGTKYKQESFNNLYEFWGNKITDKVNSTGENIIINLSSNEYFKSIKQKGLNPKIINIIFKQHKNGKLKTIGLMAKRVRGLMANFIIKNAITNPEKLKEFNESGYSFIAEESTSKNWLFTMDMEN